MIQIQRVSVLAILFFCLAFFQANAQQQRPIATKIQQRSAAFKNLKSPVLLKKISDQALKKSIVETEVAEGTFFSLQSNAIKAILKNPSDLLHLSIPVNGAAPLELALYQANFLTKDFHVFRASKPNEPFPYTPGLYYWGIANGDEHSLAAITINEGEITGFVHLNGEVFNLGKLNETSDGTHILYKETDLKISANITCGTDNKLHYIGNKVDGTISTPDANPDNCVKMYIEVDYDIFLGKGGVQQASDYVNNVFSQVAILYANESINFSVNEIFVWDVVDPYTGPSTSNYLTQFRNHLNGNYNGDLAHLVGYQGSGGIAYVDVLCNSYYGVGYSDINPTYDNVPTYSWTVEVLTHEIGHNLGSSHTHDCVWNGNNTAIDGCGPAAGYGNNCGGGPIPDAGTIMSYCHLVSGVGIDFNLGFGPQPGDRIRSEVTNAPCLAPCASSTPDDAGIASISVPSGSICGTSVSPEVELFNYGSNDLTSVTINYQLDGNPPGSHSWTGTLASNASTMVTLPAITYGTGSHTFDANTSNPNGEVDTDPSNDASSSNFDLADSDGDGVCDALDICPGGDDAIDSDNDGIPDFCECNLATEVFADNPLTHTGSGSNSTTVAFAVGSKNPSFTISNLGSKLSGNPNSRYIDEVTVSYLNGSGNPVTYGIFTGNNVSSVAVDITSEVQSVTVKLADGYDGNYGGTLSVSFGDISYCSPGAGCPDADNDGVCDVNDVCPGFDDNLIGTSCDDDDVCTENDVYGTDCLCAGIYADSDGDGVCDAQDICPGGNDNVDLDGDGIPDFCDNSNCSNEVSSSFSQNPLTHIGTGSAESNVTLPPGNTNISFTINDLNAQTNGNPSKRYIEQVTVTYVDGLNQSQTEGTYRGDVQSTVNVNISGEVKSLSISLTDIYDGDTGNEEMSVSMTDVISCPPSGLIKGGDDSQIINEITIYPNPIKEELMIRFDQAPAEGQVILTSLLGTTVAQYPLNGEAFLRIDMNALNLNSQVLFVSVRIPGQDPVTKRLLLVR